MDRTARKTTLREELRERFCRPVVAIMKVTAPSDNYFDRAVFGMPYQSWSDSKFLRRVGGICGELQGPRKEMFASHGITDELAQGFRERVTELSNLVGQKEFRFRARESNEVGIKAVELRIRNESGQVAYSSQR